MLFRSVNLDMIRCAHERFAAEPEVHPEASSEDRLSGKAGGNKGDQVVELMEITMRNLLSSGAVDLSDFLARADMLAAAGKTVLISDYFEYYRLAAYLARFTTMPIAVTMGLGSLAELFNEDYYTKLEGGILEAFGKLFTKDLRIYVYPLRDPATGLLNTADNVKIPANLRSLFRHLVDRGRIKQLGNFDESILHIFSRDVLQRIKNNDAEWENMVPPEIAEMIKRRQFFGYREAEGNALIAKPAKASA